RRAVRAFLGVGARAAPLAAGAWVSVAFLAGWDVAALVFLVWVWSTVASKDAAATAASAQSEVPSRSEGEVVFLGAGSASLIAVAFTLVEAGRQSGGVRALLIALAVGSVMLAWASVHTVHALRSARLYYGEPAGGIDFNDDAPPRYLDFAYVALTIGMTSAISDTSLTSTRLRRTTIHHALLSYVFGTVVVA